MERAARRVGDDESGQRGGWAARSRSWCRNHEDCSVNQGPRPELLSLKGESNQLSMGAAVVMKVRGKE